MQNVSVLYDDAVYDNFPVLVTIQISVITVTLNNKSKNLLLQECVDWPKFDDEVKANFRNRVEEILKDFHICEDSNFQIDHSMNLDSMYQLLLRSIKYGSEPYLITRAKKFKSVPGWNTLCRHLYNLARKSFKDWLINGKIMHGVLYERMEESRKKFVSSLNYCKRNRQKLADEALAKATQNKNSKLFWKQVRSRNNASVGISEIDGASDDMEIARVFFCKTFSAISGDGVNNSSRYFVNNSRAS